MQPELHPRKNVFSIHPPIGPASTARDGTQFKISPGLERGEHGVYATSSALDAMRAVRTVIGIARGEQFRCRSAPTPLAFSTWVANPPQTLLTTIIAWTLKMFRKPLRFRQAWLEVQMFACQRTAQLRLHRLQTLHPLTCAP